MRRALASLLLLAACGQAQLPPFGQLHAPGSIAVNVPTGRIFVASETADELRVLDASRRDPAFLKAPNPLFPLSIPTVHWPSAVASGRDIVFVLSSAEAELGFVNARATPPRSVDVGGFPRTLPLDMLATSLAALDGEVDRALVAGVAGDQQGQLLVVKAAPPVIETTIALPGTFPADVQVEPGIPAAVLGADGLPVGDCRLVAVADDRAEPGHTPGVILLQLRAADGSLDVATPPRSFPVPVSVDLGAGQSEIRNAPVKAVAFAPAPITSSQLAAVAADPCAPRSGRLIAVLDPVYCGSDVPCRDVAFLDIGTDPSGALTLDVAGDVQGGDAIYDVPGVALGAAIAEGPFTLARSGSTFGGGFSPAEPEGTVVRDAPTIAVVTSSDRSSYLIASGLGTPLVGPAPGTRGASDPVTRVDADPGLARATEVRRSGGGTGLPPPTVVVPVGAVPRSQTWTATFRGAIPGFAGVAVADILPNMPQEIPIEAPRGLVNFHLPIAVVPGDVLLPRPGGDVVCSGFPVTDVAADGSSLHVDVPAAPAGEPPICRAHNTPLDIVPSEQTPWILIGSSTGFVGRLPNLESGGRCPLAVVSGVFDGEDLQFQFTPPGITSQPADVHTPCPETETPPPGTAWTFETRSGFTFLGVAPDPNTTTVLLPSAIVALPRATLGDPGPGLRVFITYSGTNSVLAINPDRPAAGSLGLFE